MLVVMALAVLGVIGDRDSGQQSTTDQSGVDGATAKLRDGDLQNQLQADMGSLLDTKLPALRAVPSVKLYDNFNNALNVIVPKGTSRGGTISYLGNFGAMELCQQACIANEQRCWHFVYLKPQVRSDAVPLVRADMAGGGTEECYAVLSPGFNPSYDENAITGSVEWDCRSHEDCSLNGKCQAGTCQCRAAWKGLRCETLDVLPPARDAGYRGVDDGRHTSSWGGAVLRDANGQYHMWASEMTEHCGIGAWVQNSRIIHAIAANASGPYIRKDVTRGVFAHEPEVVPGPNGEYIMFFTANPRPDGGGHGWCNCCRKDSGPCDGSTGPEDCPGDAPGQGDSYMSWTMDPNGEWSEPVKIFEGYTSTDTNFAPVILPNGSLVATWRHWGGGNGGSRQFLATGADWKDPSTYVRHNIELFPDLGAAGTEDQFLYQDDDGYFHAWFHHMYGTGTESQWWLDATGGHAFSRDGWSWTYTGVSWGNPLARYNTPAGQGVDITFQDGVTMKFTRVERPHFVFKGRQLQGDPIYITNSVQYGTGTDPTASAHNDDACYTLVMPVAH